MNTLNCDWDNVTSDGFDGCTGCNGCMSIATVKAPISRSKTKVIGIKEAPQMKNPAILQGIRDRAAAQAWGEKNGYPVVYFITRKQRVYAERFQAKVNELAEQIERQSSDLLAQAEMML